MNDCRAGSPDELWLVLYREQQYLTALSIRLPFTESKEIVGGFGNIEAASKEDALGFARRFMDLHLEHWPSFEGDCEVRPFELEP